MSNLYNISSSHNFVEVLAQKLLNDYNGHHQELTNVLILLPNRRACRSLADAFVRLHGMEPTLLPQMRAIADIKEDELLLTFPQTEDFFLNTPPPIDNLERTLLLMKLIKSRYKEFGLESVSLSQSCYLAQELGKLLDNVSMRNLSWDNLQKIVPFEYASHWQETLQFLKIITEYWPQILHERGVIDVQSHNNLLMQKLTELWQKSPPSSKIIIAGTTAVSPAMKNLVRTVLEFETSEVYLAGLDKYLDEDSWNIIDESHPQSELKQLLDFLQINRSQVIDLSPPANPMREKLLSEIMRPASSTDQWRNLPSLLNSSAISGIYLMECNNIRHEALSIAILMRQTLETPQQSIALVTPDRNLARRVSAELNRWNIKVDDSAGIPLNQTIWGIFIREIINAAKKQASRTDIITLLKNPLFSNRLAKEEVSSLIYSIDKNIWRQKQEDPKAQDFLDKTISLLQPLTHLLQQDQVEFSQLLQTHIQIAETLSKTDSPDNTSILWSGDDGNTGADFIANLLEKSTILGAIPPCDYLDLLEAFMSNISVRQSSTLHPRIKILGPMEARLNHYDIIIIGGCVEGVWPSPTQVDPWMSRPMKKDFGLQNSEQQIGVTALDFSNLLGSKKVYLTKSQMNDGAQTIVSRWWLRLTTVLEAAKIDTTELYEKHITEYSKLIDEPLPQEISKITPPEPHPPVSMRPKKLSASAFEKLLRDPYSVFAQYILQLKPLDDIENQIDQSDFGNFIHKILEDFNIAYPCSFPSNAKDILLNAGELFLQTADFPLEKVAFWRPKFRQIVEWIVNTEKVFRNQISKIYSEIWGSKTFENTAMGDFTIYAKADRIDKTIDNTYNIIDYKTGQARTLKEIKSGYAPQLPIEALIAQSGGFDGLSSAPISQLMYWKLNDKVISLSEDIDNLISQTSEHIIEIINLFAKEETGYLSRPNPKHIPEYSDYEHLARVKEWSIQDKGDDN